MSEFSKRVKNLAQFIDILNLTTAYKKGVSVGCRIGSSESNSLAKELGLQAGDVILTMDGIPATNNKNRLKIYKKVVAVHLDDVVTVRLQREGRNYTLRYKFVDFSVVKRPTSPGQPVTAGYIQKEQEKMLKKRYKFAPTVRDMRNQERKLMLQKGKKPLKKLEP